MADPRGGSTAALIRAGFERLRHEVVEKTGLSPSAAEAATGLIEGNPILGEIMKR